MTNNDIVRAAFDAYNARTSEALLSLVADDVAWPSPTGVLDGKGALHDFRTRQWETTRMQTTSRA